MMVNEELMKKFLFSAFNDVTSLAGGPDEGRKLLLELYEEFLHAEPLQERHQYKDFDEFVGVNRHWYEESSDPEREMRAQWEQIQKEMDITEEEMEQLGKDVMSEMKE